MSGEVKKLKSCGCEADDHPDCISYPSATLGEGPKPATREGVNESQSKFLRNLNRWPISRKITQAIKRSGQSLE